MNEVKTPKKPLAFYYMVVMLILLLFNFIALPQLVARSVKEVDYGKFMTMTKDKQIGEVQIQSDEIIFTDKDTKQVYRTGLMDDPGLVDRLYASGADFSSEIIQQMSPFMSFLLSWVVPIAIFALLGHFLSAKMMDKVGGGSNSMMFGMGKSNARVYVQSTEGIRFGDVAGEEEAKENLKEYRLNKMSGTISLDEE